MTNYRFNVCEYHDGPELKFCFTCGAPLRRYDRENPGDYAHIGEPMLTCSREPVHVKIWLYPHDGDSDRSYCTEKFEH